METELKSKNLRSLIKENGYSQRAFGKMIHKSQRTITSWCNRERNPKMKDIRAIARLLDMDYEDVLLICILGKDKGANEKF